MNEKGRIEIDVRQGANPSLGGAGSVGGLNAYFDDDGLPTVMLSAMPNEGGFTDHELHEGDTFEVGSELWQVTKIDDPNTDYWSAVLTRLR